MATTPPAFFANYQKLQKLLADPKQKFLLSIYVLRNKYNLPLDPKNVDLSTLIFENKFQQIDKALSNVALKRKNFISKLEDKSAFISDLHELLDDYKLGDTWKLPISDMLFGVWYPPFRNFTIIEDLEKKEVLIKLSPETTLADLQEAWTNYILPIKKKIVGHQLQHFSKTFHNTLPKLELYKKLKNQKLKDVTKNTLYTSNSLDIIAQLYPEDDDIQANADQKRLNNLKKFRSRLKKR